MPTPERRQYPRFSAADRLAGVLLEENLPVRIRDIGLGGFSIETMTPLEPGVDHRIRFVARDDWSTELPATVANVRPSCAADGTPLFVAGCAFADGNEAATRRTVETLIEKVTSVQLYGEH